MKIPGEINNAFQDYINALCSTQDISKTFNDKGASEHSHRMALGKLLERITNKVQCINEPGKLEGLGCPDIAVMCNKGPIGYIETKRHGTDIERKLQDEQITKYSKNLENLLVTNYVDFIWLRNGKRYKNASLAHSLGQACRNTKALNAEEVYDILEEFTSVPPTNINNAKKLAKALAIPTRVLRDFFIDNGIDKDRGGVYGLYEDFQERVFKVLTIEEFINVFVQLIVYGLFLARLNTDGKTILTLDNAYKYIPNSFDLIRQLTVFFRELEEKRYAAIKPIIEGHIIVIINSFDFQAIHDELKFSKDDNQEIKDDPFIHFYEDFLEEFDPETRTERGVFYTPIPIVKFIVRGVQDILKEKFGIERGLADDKRVTVLDFAAGTGTFLLEMFKEVLSNLPKGSGKIDGVAKGHLLKNFYGFEYMMAPYAIAHIKLSEFLKEQGYNFEDDDRIGVYLTNTLETRNNQQQSLIPYLQSLNEEGEKAQEIKDKPVLVIVGNPPYNVNSRNKDSRILSLIEDYKYIDGKKLKEKNCKSLQDDYVKFIRFAQDKMDAVEEGIVAVITNHGFLDNPTFRAMRASLLKSFNLMYFVNLHGNSIKKEKCPDGSKDENVFDIKQGVCISFFVKKSGINGCVFYTDFWGDRESKYDRLCKETIGLMKWDELMPDKDQYKFVLYDNKFDNLYSSFVSINDIFIKKSVGILAGRDKFTIDFESHTLFNRIKDFAKLSPEDGRSKYNLGPDSRDWQVALAQKSIVDSGCSIKNVHDITYRPFDTRKLYYTAKSKGIISQPLYNVMQHMINHKNIGLTFSRRKTNFGDYTHVFVSKYITNYDLHSNRKYLAPLYQYSFVDNLNHTNKSENLTPEFRLYINNLYNHTYTPEEILGYIYGVLHSQTYRTKYLDQLKQDFPRIPFTKDRPKFEKLSKLGWKLVQVHLMDDEEPQKLGLGAYMGTIGGHIVEKPEYHKETQRLYINKTQYFDNVPKEVWEFYIGGYQVLDKYLKSRKKRVLDYTTEITHIEKVINILAFTIGHVKEIDPVYKAIDEEVTDNV